MHHAVVGQVMVAFRHCVCIAIAASIAPMMLGNSSRKPSPVFLTSATAVVEDDRVDGAAMRLERGVGPRLVGAHQAGIAGDVGANDGRETFSHRPFVRNRRLARLT